jgi:hypothetical protein
MYWAVEGVLCIAIVDLRVALRERPIVEDARLLESTLGTVDIQSDLMGMFALDILDGSSIASDLRGLSSTGRFEYCEVCLQPS